MIYDISVIYNKMAAQSKLPVMISDEDIVDKRYENENGERIYKLCTRFTRH